MVETELISLLAVLRANGVTEYRTPELTLVLGPAVERPAEVTGTPAEREAGLDPRVRAALDRLPAGYRDPRLWSGGA